MQAQSLTKYAKCIKEAYGDELIENDYGFITYQVNGENILIKELWVEPNHRNKGAGIHLANTVARIGRDGGCKFLMSLVSKNAKHYASSLSANLYYGFEIVDEDESKVYLQKGL